jgi:DNA-binding LacI/PurR family transcriptional regulator
MAKPRKITMAELARLADVDVSTVSRALSDSPLVKEETKTEILKIARKTGYAVNASARNLRRQSSEAIGMVIPLRPESGQTLSDPFFLEMVGAVSQAAADRGYDLIISVPKGEEEIAEQRLLSTGKADGLIIIGQAGRTERLKALGPLAVRMDRRTTHSSAATTGKAAGWPPSTYCRLAGNEYFSSGRPRCRRSGFAWRASRRRTRSAVCASIKA